MSTPRGITIREIADARGLAVDTVLYHRGRAPDLWRSWEVGVRDTGHRGRPEKEYDAAEVARYYEAKESASPQGRRGPKRRHDEHPRDEIVGWKTIAQRLGISPDTARGYPTRYARGNNPFPAQVEPGKYLWGDVADWDDRRGKSGRPGPRILADGVSADTACAHIKRLEQGGMALSAIAEVSGVPARTVRRIAIGELVTIKPEYRDALLATSPLDDR